MRSRNKLVCGVGINDASYEVYQKVDGVKATCPFYVKWKSMLERVYVEKNLVKRPSYRNCSVVKDWLRFSAFKEWMQQQNWQGKHLDKDLIGNGCLYSPDACVFVSQEINSFINEHSNANGLWPVGVSKRERSKINKYEAHCNVFAESRQKKKFLGSYFTPEEAHQAWKVEKLKQAKILAATVDDQRIAEALIRRYS